MSGCCFEGALNDVYDILLLGVDSAQGGTACRMGRVLSAELNDIRIRPSDTQRFRTMLLMRGGGEIDLASRCYPSGPT